MNNKIPVIVELPNLKPTVALPRGLGETLELIIAAESSGISSVALSEAGNYSAKNNISRHRKLGACIETQRKSACDRHGHQHRAIAFYTYTGWEDQDQLSRRNRLRRLRRQYAIQA